MRLTFYASFNMFEHNEFEAAPCLIKHKFQGPGGLVGLGVRVNLLVQDQGLTNLVFYRLDHPNVVKLLEAYESKSYVYLVMEL